MGWGLWESVDRVVNNGNYGWSIMEGPQPVYPTARREPAAITAPELVLTHTEAAAVIGGLVYHGKRLAELQGHYIFGDSETRRLFAADGGAPRLPKAARRHRARSSATITSSPRPI